MTAASSLPVPRRRRPRRVDALALYGASVASLLLSRVTRGGGRLARWTRPLSGRLSEARTRSWYAIITSIFAESWGGFLNYGYAELTPTGRTLGLSLSDEDEPHRLQIQLYERAMRGVEVADRDVVEVSCGHGGGAAWVARGRGPRGLLGIDANPRAIRFCRRRHAISRLRFRVGRAEALGLQDASCDVVVSVEASHCYSDVPAFLRDTHRVLRPGGRLLLADFRCGSDDQQTLAVQVGASGFQVEAREEIGANVLRALELDQDRKARELAWCGNGRLERGFRAFFGARGAPIEKALREGRCKYLRYVLRKPAAPRATEREAAPGPL
jgi:SAM-dependent methyltransferase